MKVFKSLRFAHIHVVTKVINSFFFALQMTSLTKHRNDHDTIESNSVQFKNVMEARYW